MKLKCIRKESEIKGGTWYIRAVINCHGSFWIETHKVHGRPFDSKAKCFKGEHRRQIRQASKYDWGGEYYLESLGVGSTEVFGVRMIPFSAAAFNLLSGIKDVRSFADAINNRKVTDEEFAHAQSDWAFMKHMDEESDRMCYEQSEEDPFERMDVA